MHFLPPCQSFQDRIAFHNQFHADMIAFLRTLFCLSAATSPQELRQRKSSARIDVVDVEIPSAGYP